MSVTRDADVHGPDKWEADLRAAGWRAVRRGVWRRPDGALFRGPYGAWCALYAFDSEKNEAVQVGLVEGCGTETERHSG